jgi:hypothetical protein
MARIEFETASAELQRLGRDGGSRLRVRLLIGHRRSIVGAVRFAVLECQFPKRKVHDPHVMPSYLPLRITWQSLGDVWRPPRSFEALASR